jgi:hypothetical protein
LAGGLEPVQLSSRYAVIDYRSYVDTTDHWAYSGGVAVALFYEDRCAKKPLAMHKRRLC